MTTGIGWKSERGRPQDTKSVGFIKEGPRLIAESIHRIINTRPGERPGNPFFGCRIQEVLFEPNGFAAGTLGAYYVSEALERFEPRIVSQEINVNINRNTNELVIEIIFNLVDNSTETFRTVSSLPIGE